MTPWMFSQRQKEDHVRGEAVGRLRGPRRDGRYFPVVADDQMQTEVGMTGMAAQAAMQAMTGQAPSNPPYMAKMNPLLTMARQPKMGHWPHLKFVRITRPVL